MNYGFPAYIKENRKRFSVYFALVIAAVLLFFVKGHLESPYLYDKDGNLSGIINEGRGTVVLHIRAERNGKAREEDAVLDFNKKRKKKPEADEEAYELDREIEKVVRFLESQGKREIRLPVKGEKGLEFSWKAEKNYKPLLLPLLFPMFLFSMYYGDLEKEKREKKEYSRKIKRRLPAFNQQVVLLMNSGLVFSDAFGKIAGSYKAKKGKKDPFEELIITIQSEAERRTESLGTVLSEFSYNLGHREFSRLTAIITEHEFRGSDLRDKMMDESRILWEERKKDAQEAGKKGETALSFPLGILLVVLIMVTACPAVIEI